jgi:hypothetical protein
MVDDWGQQLDPSRTVAHGQHRFSDALLDVRLLVNAHDAERVAIEGNRLVEVGDRNADMVDPGE